MPLQLSGKSVILMRDLGFVNFAEKLSNGRYIADNAFPLILHGLILAKRDRVISAEVADSVSSEILDLQAIQNVNMERPGGDMAGSGKSMKAAVRPDTLELLRQIGFGKSAAVLSQGSVLEKDRYDVIKSLIRETDVKSLDREAFDSPVQRVVKDAIKDLNTSQDVVKSHLSKHFNSDGTVPKRTWDPDDELHDDDEESVDDNRNVVDGVNNGEDMTAQDRVDSAQPSLFELLSEQETQEREG